MQSKNAIIISDHITVMINLQNTPIYNGHAYMLDIHIYI